MSEKTSLMSERKKWILEAVASRKDFVEFDDLPMLQFLHHVTNNGCF